MPNPTPPQTLTIALGFNGTLQILYPNGKSIDLPKGLAEARLLEVLEGFRRSFREIKQEVYISDGPSPTPIRKGFPKPVLDLATLLAAMQVARIEPQED